MQFHPEVAHTPRGGEILNNFLFEICGCTPDWTAGHFVESEVARIRELVGPSQRVICGLSGGVDSLGGGGAGPPRGGRPAHLHLRGPRPAPAARAGAGRDRPSGATSASTSGWWTRATRFLERLAGVTDPEEKRRRIGHTFIDVFEAEAKAVGNDVGFLVQGTLYPDVIESISPRGGPSVTIKTHHNVGGLPERLPFKLLEPLRELFKDEVRQVGRELGLPEEMVGRHPFPGPGPRDPDPGRGHPPRTSTSSAGRITSTSRRSARPGCTTTSGRRSRCCCRSARSACRATSAPTIRSIALRAVTSRDGMTADWFPFPPEVLGAHLQPDRQRGGRRQPRGLRRQLQAAGDDRVGVSRQRDVAGNGTISAALTSHAFARAPRETPAAARPAVRRVYAPALRSDSVPA